MQSFTASAIQLKAGSDEAANLAQATALVESAAAGGASLVALPEMFLWRGPQRDEPAHAQPIPGPVTRFASELAARLSIHLVAGSFLEAVAGERRSFNTCTLFGPDGALLASYRKMHLFDVDIDGQVAIQESATRQPGDAAVCVDTPLGRIGLAVCYDLRFPELFRALADRGAEIVVMPSAFTGPTGAAHWHPLVRARAIENQVYFIAPNQFGPTGYGFDDYGHSLIVDPWGVVLADAADDGPRVVTAQVDAERLADVRRKLPASEHRRLRS